MGAFTVSNFLHVLPAGTLVALSLTVACELPGGAPSPFATVVPTRPLIGSTPLPSPSPSPSPTGVAAGHESWVWVYNSNIGWPAQMNEVAANATSFTHLSPTFYTLNYVTAYASGAADYVTCAGGAYACTANGANNFGTWKNATLMTETFTAWAHGLGLKVVPAIYAGSANGGSDASIEAILCHGSTSTCGVQSALIAAMVTEAVNNGYDGYNLDWEAGSSIGKGYAAAFVAFVNAFKAALTAQLPKATLSADAIVSNINGTWCSGNNGYIDFGLLSASSIDRVMIENYVSQKTQSGWAEPTACETSNPWGSTALNDSSPIGCDYTLTGMMNMMCPPNLGATPALDFDKAVIGLDASVGATNPIAGDAFAALKSFGFTKVAVWPQYDNNANPFMSTDGIVPSTMNWYDLLKAVLNP